MTHLYAPKRTQTYPNNQFLRIFSCKKLSASSCFQSPIPMTTYDVKDLINSRNAIMARQGEMLYNAIKPRLNSNEVITLSFAGLHGLTSAFINVFLGLAYNEYPLQAAELKFDFDGSSLMDGKERVLDAVNLIKDTSKREQHEDNLIAYCL